MITVPTVFVLGAGASHPYGLPLGYQLRLNILDRYNVDEGHATYLLNMTPFRRHDITTFIEALRYSGLVSVDAFLERRPEFMEIGKAMMGIELLHGEVHERLWGDDENWLVYLYGGMVGSSLEEFAENRVSFVTFNYDRSVEQFLFTSLKNTFGRPDGDTSQVLQKVPIVHLHGRLGYLPWQERKTTIEYGDNQIDVRKMSIVTKEIKVVHEELTDGRDKDFQQAQELLGQARRLYLLGFGFGTRNVQRLGLIDLAPHIFSGTAYGMTQRESSGCRMISGGRVNLHDYPCLEFLRNIAELD